MTSHQVPYQSESHVGLLDEFRRPPVGAKFDAILVPTYRPVGMVDRCIDLARKTRTPLIVLCSKAVRATDVISSASRAGIEAYALDMKSANLQALFAGPLEPFSFETSNEEFAAAGLKRNRDLSMKRNFGLILARMRRWTRLMFLDDDIYITEDDVDALATALDDHSISAVIPEHFPDNSVACHTHRLSGGQQRVFASASGIGVRCDRDDLAFFPDIYNEDWFFFSAEAAAHKIAKVGVSRQIVFDPYDNPLRAAHQEFGDLLAEGLYARLDINEGISSVDAEYWGAFIKIRTDFHKRAEKALNQFSDKELEARARDLRYISDPDLPARIRDSIQAAQDQLREITPSLCQRFVDSWQSDLAKWRNYLAELPYVDSTADAFNRLGFDPAVPSPNSR